MLTLDLFPALELSVTARRLLLVTLVAILAGCAVTPPAPPISPTPPTPPTPAAPTLPAQYQPVTFDVLPGWRDDEIRAVWPAFLMGCKALLAKPARSAPWEAPCRAAATLDARDDVAVRTFFETHFSPYQVTAPDGRDTGLVTGYYEPLLLGSRTWSARYPAPLYGPPDDLLTIDLAELYPEFKGKRLRGRVEGRRVVPYWDRAGIDAGRAELSSRALVYVEDPVEAFFLEIQGSGRIQLEDGSVVRLGYADQNGHPYRAIGRVLAERGYLEIERTSMQNIRAWGRRNPDKLPEILEANPSYVFFREVPPFPPGSLEAMIDGPIGSLGVPLLRERTVAVDPRALPLGAPLFLATTYPSTSRPLQRTVIAQDTGGAIRGAVRVDYFWGFGPEAGQQAGRMRQEGRVWMLWPKGAPPPDASGG